MTRLAKRLLLLMHSSRWRTQFGEEYTELLDRRPLDAFEIWDAIQSGAHSHARVQSWAPLGVAIGGAAFSGFLCIQDNGYAAAAAVIMLVSFVLTAWKPQHWWLWLSIAALSAPSSYMVASVARVAISRPPETLWQAFALFGPATLAATVAMAIRIAVAVRGCRKQRALTLGLSHPE